MLFCLFFACFLSFFCSFLLFSVANDGPQRDRNALRAGRITLFASCFMHKTWPTPAVTDTEGAQGPYAHRHQTPHFTFYSHFCRFWRVSAFGIEGWSVPTARRCRAVCSLRNGNCKRYSPRAVYGRSPNALFRGFGQVRTPSEGSLRRGPGA